MVKASILVIFLLQSAPAPIRVGELAKKLTTKDVMELEKIAAAGGNKESPWLLESPAGPYSNSIRIYLPPTSQTREVRRGLAIELMRRPGQTAWTPSQRLSPLRHLEEKGDTFPCNAKDRVGRCCSRALE